MLWRRLIMRIFAQAYQWQSYCKKLSNQKKNSSFFHRKQKKSNFYQFPRKIGDSCHGDILPWGQVPGSAGNAQMPGTCPLLCCFPNNWKFFIFN
jgi:hypothetical protein